MSKLYKKNEVLFAIMWIVIYVVLLSVADNLSEIIGVDKLVTAIVSLALSAIVFVWIKKNNVLDKYGLCKSNIPARKMLFYIPLVF